MRCGKRVHDSAPDTSPPPANEAIIAGGIRPEASGQVPPRCAGAQDPEYAIEDTAVIHTWYAARLIWQHWPDGEPLAVGKCVAHESSSILKAWIMLRLLLSMAQARLSDVGFWGVKQTLGQSAGMTLMTQPV